MAPGDAAETQQELVVAEVCGWKNRIGQAHRRVSLPFTAAAVGSTTAVLAERAPAERVCFMPSLTLALLMATGPYVFIPADVARRRSSAQDSGRR